MDFKISRAGHVVLRVTDVAREKRLLEDVIGFTTSAQAGEHFFFLTAQPVSNHHMIAVRPGKDGDRLPEPERHIGMVMISYEVTDFPELQRIYKRIKQQGADCGARIVKTEDRGHTNNFTMADADGNQIEFYCYLPEDQAAGATPYVLRGSIEDKLNGVAA